MPSHRRYACGQRTPTEHCGLVIENLRIRNFRGIEDLRLEGLGRLNLVVGPNGAAKTSLLHAVFLLCAESNAEDVVGLVRTEEVTPDLASMERALGWWIHRRDPDGASAVDSDQRGAEFEATYSGENRAAHLSLTRPSTRVIEPSSQRASDGRDHHASQQFESAPNQQFEELRQRARFVLRLDHRGPGSTSSLEVAFVKGRGPVAREANGRSPIPAVIVHANSYSGREPPSLPRLVSEAERVRKLELVVRFLQLFDSAVEDLRVAVVADGQPVTRVLHRRLGLVPIGVLGDGFVAACTTLLGLVTVATRVALIDEFDSRLHVGVVQRMIPLLHEVARSQDTQIFLTSHRQDSVEAVATLPSQALADIRVIQMARHEGAIRAQVIPGDAAHRLVSDLGLDLRQPT